MDTNPGLTIWLTQWNWQPSLIVGTVVIIALYIAMIGPLRVKYQLGPEVPLKQAAAFLIGVDLIFVALFSPLDAVGDTYLFTAHMIQHMILAIFAPPLLLLGIPAWIFQLLLRNRFVFVVGKGLTQPLVSAFLFNANLWFWHAPLFYNATLANPSLHIFSHLLYIATGLLFWWPILSPLSEGWPPLSLGGKIAYIFFSDMPMVLLGAGLTFTPSLYYRYQNAPHLFGLSADADQQLGGLIMWIIGSIFLIVLVSIFFLSWMLQQEEKDRTREGEEVIEESLDISH